MEVEYNQPLAARAIPMTYFKAALSVVAALFFGLIGPGIFNGFHGITRQQATGLGAVAGGLAADLLNPLLWILVIALFLCFRATSRLRNVALRTLLFWIPTVTASLLSLAVSVLFAYAMWVLKARSGS